MNKPLKTLFFALLLVFVTVRCSPAASPKANTEQSGSSGQQGGQATFNRDALNSYTAEFLINFQGPVAWSYLIKTRKVDQLREIDLHIDGLPKAQNPGDIRLVTNGTRTSMIGEGTDQECVQFPNNQGMDPAFIYPESLVSFPNSALRLVEGKPEGAPPAAAGSVLEHYRASGVKAGAWKNATIDLWKDKASGMLYQFSMEGDGEDPFFGSGSGKLTAIYRATAQGEQTIEPVAGCAISVRLPEKARMFVRLPGMASFESKSSPDEIQQFFQSSLAEDDWSEVEPPAQAEGATVLSYQRGVEGVEIHIEPAGGGSKVKLLFLKSQ